MWTQLITLGLSITLKIIDVILARSKQKEIAKQKMMEFMKKYNERVMDNVKIRRQYEDLLKKRKESKGS